MSGRGPAVAIILARGGSKGVPAKNRAPVAGRPCIEWTIDHALTARRVAAMAVSSDDPQILYLARARGVLALDRPAELASDTARVDDAARDALRRMERAGLAEPGPSTPVVLLYGNVPVRPAGLVDRAVDLLLETSADSVQSYAPVGKHHPWWMVRLDDRGGVRPWEGDVLNHGVFRRQDLPPAFIPDGGVAVCTRRALMLEIPGVPPGPHAFLGLQRRGVANPEGSVVDIDTPLDLLVASAILGASPTPGASAEAVGAKDRGP